MARLRRIMIYLREMYPPLHALVPLIMAFIVFAMLFALGEQPLELNPVLVAGAVSLSLFVLLIRIMDEFKDYQDDLKNYPDRPLPSGRVSHADLLYLGGGVVIALILLNMFVPIVFAAALAVGSFSFLMLKWFFMERRIRASLPLALLTHNPIVYLHLFYAYICFLSQYGVSTHLNFLYLLPLGLLGTNWELARKIRSPEQETEYVTYSKIWGPRRALLATLICLGLAFFGTMAFFTRVSTPWWYVAIFVLGFLWTLGPYVHFLLRCEAKLPLRQAAEKSSLFFSLAIATACFLL